MVRLAFRLGCLLCLCTAGFGQTPGTVAWVQEILNNWEVTCERELRISRDPLPWIIVFDAIHAWHINPELKLRPRARRTTHSVWFAGRRYDIYEAAHESKLWVPGRPPINIAPIAVTMTYAGNTKSYFVLGTPEFMVAQKFTGGSPESKSFRDLLGGLAMHELAHTRQLPQLMPLLEGLQKRFKFPESVDDNLIETTFAKDAEFKAMYDQAGAHLQAAILATENAALAKEESRQALLLVRGWQKRFFTGERAGWAEMEEAFLTMEGAGQWVLYRHALRNAPQGQAWQQTLVNVASATDSWSQSLGLGLFLLINRFVLGWSAKYFSGSPAPSPLRVLESAIAE